MMDFKEIKSLVNMNMVLDRYGIALNKGRAPCPIHNGDNPTAFSVSNCGQFWTCHTGCGTGDIFSFVEKHEGIDTAAAKLRIMEMFALSDDRPQKPKPKPAEKKPKSNNVINRVSHIYRDTDGNEVFRVNRVDYDDGRKDCFQECDGKRTLPKEKRCLYNLDKIEQNKNVPVFLCEGEKTADALSQVGAIATTNPLGSKNWNDSYAEPLRDRQVVLMPDADEHGEEWRNAVLKSLCGVCESVQVVQMPNEFIKEHQAFTGHDFADYLHIHREDKAGEDLFEWTENAEVMPKGVSAKILGRPSDGFKLLQKRAALGIRTDVFNLNRWLPSLDIDINKGDLLVLMANTSTGKTRLLHNMPYFIRNVNYGMFDLELSLDTLFERYGAFENKISVRDFKQRLIDKRELKAPRVDNVYLQKIEKLTVSKIRERVEQLEMLTGREIHCVSVDYIGLMSGTGSKYESTSDNVEEFKAYVSEAGKVGILTTQVSRPQDKEDGMYRCPSPFSAKNSGSIENSAQCLLGFWKDEHEKRRLWARCLKYTHGEYNASDIALNANDLVITEVARGY